MRELFDALILEALFQTFRKRHDGIRNDVITREIWMQAARIVESSTTGESGGSVRPRLGIVTY